ncbi:MAG TPA: hypothetical protein VEY51_11655 [Chondromyces sp.]|nr:hypothetical protein [Chondromyces sp.]
MKKHKRVPRHLFPYMEKEIMERLMKRAKMSRFQVIEGGKVIDNEKMLDKAKDETDEKSN